MQVRCLQVQTKSGLPRGPKYLFSSAVITPYTKTCLILMNSNLGIDCHQLSVGILVFLDPTNVAGLTLLEPSRRRYKSKVWIMNKFT